MVWDALGGVGGSFLSNFRGFSKKMKIEIIGDGPGCFGGCRGVVSE